MIVDFNIIVWGQDIYCYQHHRITRRRKFLLRIKLLRLGQFLLAAQNALCAYVFTIARAAALLRLPENKTPRSHSGNKGEQNEYGKQLLHKTFFTGTAHH
jgi:hypothetical protein